MLTYGRMYTPKATQVMLTYADEGMLTDADVC
jgi:hypothetical protein